MRVQPPTESAALSAYQRNTVMYPMLVLTYSTGGGSTSASRGTLTVYSNTMSLELTCEPALFYGTPREWLIPVLGYSWLNPERARGYVSTVTYVFSIIVLFIVRLPDVISAGFGLYLRCHLYCSLTFVTPTTVGAIQTDFLPNGHYNRYFNLPRCVF